MPLLEGVPSPPCSNESLLIDELLAPLLDTDEELILLIPISEVTLLADAERLLGCLLEILEPGFQNAIQVRSCSEFVKLNLQNA